MEGRKVGRDASQYDNPYASRSILVLKLYGESDVKDFLQLRRLHLSLRHLQVLIKYPRVSLTIPADQSKKGNLKRYVIPIAIVLFTLIAVVVVAVIIILVRHRNSKVIAIFFEHIY